jgi:preprotein translocase subunit SecE
MAKSNPIKFFKQVRQEAGRVTWPSRKETLVTTGMVLLMGIAAALFFLVVDKGISFLIKLLIG